MRFSVTYRIFAANLTEARARAQAIALEQTVEIPADVVPKGYIADEIVGRIEELGAEADGRFRAGTRRSSAGCAWSALIPAQRSPPDFPDRVLASRACASGFAVPMAA